ncbi:MAG: MarR family transcriptional regulator [Rhodovibrionaceae bacterium]
MNFSSPTKRAEKIRSDQHSPLHPEERLSALTKEAMRAYSRSMQIRLIDHNVSIGHWLFLRTLWAHPGLTQRELSEKVGLMESTTFSALKALEKLGYVTREKKPGNRKKVHINLTEQGARLESVLMPLAEELNDTAVAGIPKKEIEITRQTLIKIIDNLLLDEAKLLETERRVPSTRNLSQLISGEGDKLSAAGKARKRPASAKA